MAQKPSAHVLPSSDPKTGPPSAIKYVPPHLRDRGRTPNDRSAVHSAAPAASPASGAGRWERPPPAQLEAPAPFTARTFTARTFTEATSFTAARPGRVGPPARDARLELEIFGPPNANITATATPAPAASIIGAEAGAGAASPATGGEVAAAGGAAGGGDDRVGEGAGVIDSSGAEVEVGGPNPPQPLARGREGFAGAKLGDVLDLNVQLCGYRAPSEVQRYAIPCVMAGRDLIGCAQTGCGKTAAFMIPIIYALSVGASAPALCRPGPGGRVSLPIYGGGGGGGYRGRAPLEPRCLVLAPTRELVTQIYAEARKFTYRTGLRVSQAYGGCPVVDQLRDLERGCDVVVATPGRLTDLVQTRGRMKLCRVSHLVLDEADRMLDMGFEPQIRDIVERADLPERHHRQTLMFSATFPPEIQRLAGDFLRDDYVFLAIGRVGSATHSVAQTFIRVDDRHKRDYLLDLLQTPNTTAPPAAASTAVPPNSAVGARVAEAKDANAEAKAGLPLSGVFRTLVFVATKRSADALEFFLSKKGFAAASIHGDRTQEEREAALRAFRGGSCPVLVATDVASRGLDIPHVRRVVNFDLPAASDIDSYVHRIGRTGRGGKTGEAVSFVSEANRLLVPSLIDVLEEAKQEVPNWLRAMSSRHQHNHHKATSARRATPHRATAAPASSASAAPTRDRRAPPTRTTAPPPMRTAPPPGATTARSSNPPPRATTARSSNPPPGATTARSSNPPPRATTARSSNPAAHKPASDAAGKVDATRSGASEEPSTDSW